MLRNKKGTLLFLVVPGLIIALGILFLSTTYAESAKIVKGGWQMDFLNNNYLAAQEELLKADLLAKMKSKAVLQKLAEQGGFLTDSTCGKIEGINLLNHQEQWCLPPYYQNAEEKLGEEFLEFMNVKLVDGFLSGSAGEKKTETDLAVYYYSLVFKIDLGNFLDKYANLNLEAEKLVEECRNRKGLKSCLDNTKLKGWHYGSCTQESFPSGRKIPFCMGGIKLGLDFTPTTPYVVEEVNVGFKEGIYEISFEKDEFAESYKLYYTNWPGAVEEKGEAAEIFYGLSGYYSQERSIEEIAVDCQNKVPGEACAEGELIVYYLEDAYLNPENSFFTVTSVVEEEESPFLKFVSVATEE